MVLQRSITVLAAASALMAMAGCSDWKIGRVQDEAKIAGRTPDSLKGADEDYFADMDYGYRRASDPSVKLDVAEVRGRNSWIVWTFGSDRFWDYMANHTFGAFDLLKILSSHPDIGYCDAPPGATDNPFADTDKVGCVGA